MLQYFTDHIDTFYPEKDLQEKVLSEHPVPSNLPEVRKLDEFLEQFLGTRDEQLDKFFCKIQTRIRVLG